MSGGAGGGTGGGGGGGAGGGPKKQSIGKWYVPDLGAGSALTIKLGAMQPLLGGFDVKGFSTDTIETRVVADLPPDVFVPAEALDAIYAVKRLDLWIETGRRVQAWAEQQGIGASSWLADGDDGLRVPPGVADDDIPAFVRDWLADVPEMEAIIADVAGRV